MRQQQQRNRQQRETIQVHQQRGRSRPADCLKIGFRHFLQPEKRIDRRADHPAQQALLALRSRDELGSQFLSETLLDDIGRLPPYQRRAVAFLSYRLLRGKEDLPAIFMETVRVNDEVRLKAKLNSVVNLRGVTKAEVGAVMEIKGRKKPAFEANVVFLYYFQ